MNARKIPVPKSPSPGGVSSSSAEIIEEIFPTKFKPLTKPLEDRETIINRALKTLAKNEKYLLQKEKSKSLLRSNFIKDAIDHKIKISLQRNQQPEPDSSCLAGKELLISKPMTLKEKLMAFEEKEQHGKKESSPKHEAKSPSPKYEAKSPDSQLDTKCPSPQMDAKEPTQQLDIITPSSQTQMKCLSPPRETSSPIPPPELEIPTPPPEPKMPTPPPEPKKPSPPPEPENPSPPPEPESAKLQSEDSSKVPQASSDDQECPSPPESPDLYQIALCSITREPESRVPTPGTPSFDIYRTDDDDDYGDEEDEDEEEPLSIQPQNRGLSSLDEDRLPLILPNDTDDSTPLIAALADSYKINTMKIMRRIENTNRSCESDDSSRDQLHKRLNLKDLKREPRTVESQEMAQGVTDEEDSKERVQSQIKRMQKLHEKPVETEDDIEKILREYKLDLEYEKILTEIRELERKLKQQKARARAIRIKRFGIANGDLAPNKKSGYDSLAFLDRKEGRARRREKEARLKAKLKSRLHGSKLMDHLEPDSSDAELEIRRTKKMSRKQRFKMKYGTSDGTTSESDDFNDDVTLASRRSKRIKLHRFTFEPSNSEENPMESGSESQKLKSKSNSISDSSTRLVRIKEEVTDEVPCFQVE